MKNHFSLLPEQASTIAASVDLFYLYLIAVSALFATLIFGAVIFFAVKYRRRSDSERPKAIHGSLPLEIFWSVVPLAISLTMFAWGTQLFFTNARPPAGAMEIFVVGKQWMWKFQHPEGKREINHLHVPVGQPVRLTMTSEDVIHSFFVPAFRVKMDVLPGRYTQVWFEATKPGEYHLFCAEYCGTNHSRMLGKVTVLEPHLYEEWLSGGAAVAGAGAESMVSKGEKLYRQFNCQSCHGEAVLTTAIKGQSQGGDLSRAPALQGLAGKKVELADGRTVEADKDRKSTRLNSSH